MAPSSISLALLFTLAIAAVNSFSLSNLPQRPHAHLLPSNAQHQQHHQQYHSRQQQQQKQRTALPSTPTDTSESPTYTPPEDAIIQIQPRAMSRLIELKQKRDNDPKNPPDFDPSSPLILRMGVRNGGCSGLSYVMDFSTADEIQEEDEVDDYETEGIKCVVDAKSLLYLYGLELDYSDELIGGGFKFFNPNAEESCGCGSSFGV